MPTRQMMDVPPPRDWNEFEEIVLDALKLRWNNASIQRHGRPGQAQLGVDIVGVDDLGRLAGVQCKRLDGQLSIATVRLEAEKADAFTPPIQSFVVATSAPTDAAIQRDVLAFSEQRRVFGKCPVSVLFWPDIYGEIAASDLLFRKHYPQIAPAVVEGPDLALDLGGGQLTTIISANYNWWDTYDDDDNHFLHCQRGPADVNCFINNRGATEAEHIVVTVDVPNGCRLQRVGAVQCRQGSWTVTGPEGLSRRVRYDGDYLLPGDPLYLGPLAIEFYRLNEDYAFMWTITAAGGKSDGVLTVKPV